MHDFPVPNLTIAHSGPAFHLEETICNKVATIESWFRQQWQLTPAPITSSVDLRHAGYKLAPVDTNLFPAGFNNLNPDFMPLCVQAIQSLIASRLANCKKILLLPEINTRNRFYAESLKVLRDIFINAGFEVRLGNISSAESITIVTENEELTLEPLVRNEDKIGLANFSPCLVVLNNDLATGVPDSLQGIKQPVLPSLNLGWTSRLKSNHFKLYSEVVAEFAELLNFDPWFINPYFDAAKNIDFMAQAGFDELSIKADHLLQKIHAKYNEYDINETPYLAIKADNGTYGMSVMMIQSAEQLQQLNRKQRTKMAASKGSQKVEKVLLQEGVYSFETMENGSVAEPVVYMMGQFVVGGFYRVHQGRSQDENLNAPGMHFEPLAFAEACNVPSQSTANTLNRFYTYGVIARLAALAAAREIALYGEKA